MVSKFRGKHDMTQREAAAALNVSPGTIFRIENGAKVGKLTTYKILAALEKESD